MNAVVVVAAAAGDERAAALAQRLALPLTSSPTSLPSDCVAYLHYRDGCLQLFPADPRQSGPVCVDFVDGPLARRARAGGELIVRAVKGRSREMLHVVDATAGLGRDAFVLAANGFETTLIERNAVAAALLEDGLMRAAETSAATVAARMRLYCADAIAYCSAQGAARGADVVYLDPMFAEADNSAQVNGSRLKGAQAKSAQVKKDMRLFRQLLDSGHSDERSLLEAARAAARLRVVVKRALKAPHLAGAVPAYSLRGKAIRFDVYPL